MLGSRGGAVTWLKRLMQGETVIWKPILEPEDRIYLMLVALPNT